MEDHKLYQVALSLVPGVGNLLARTLVSYSGSAKAVFNSTKAKLVKIPGVGAKTIEAITHAETLKKAEEILLKAEKESATILSFTDKDYPDRLKRIGDAPALLFYKGNTSLNKSRSVAIVGTRKATTYGKQVTEQIVYALKEFDPLIVSGLAYGIDICAHRATLKAGLTTIGVMASGLDIIYPSVHKSTANEMINQGGILTENTFGTQPDAFKFPARNRIIAGLADVVIVVEAAIKGGALITADLANSYNREVFAVPGNINNELSAGCNNLIKNNLAQMFTSVEDMLEQLKWSKETENLNSSTTTTEASFNGLDEFEISVVKELKNYAAGIQIDELSWKTQIPISKIAGVVLNLEFKGLIKALPGKKFTLK